MLTAARSAQNRQRLTPSQRQTFILEPILTPSGFIDNGDDLFDAPLPDAPLPDVPLPDPSLSEIDDSLPQFEPSEDNGLPPDFPLPDYLPENSDFREISFIDAAESTLISELASASELAFAGEQAAGPIEPDFQAGIFTVGDSGQISIDFLFDGGGYKGELALFNLDGMEEFNLSDGEGMRDFIQEAAHRALQNDADSGYIALSDRVEGARFSGLLGESRDWNAGDYQGVKTFQMNPGNEFAFMLVPHSTVERVYTLLLDDQPLSHRQQPLFSLATANPDDSLQLGQIASVLDGGDTFVLEDIPISGGSDGDYNDLIFQIQGAAADDIPTLDELPRFADDWRTSNTGQALLDYVTFNDGERSIADHLPDPVRYAIERADNLDSYNPDALAATTQWVVGVSSRTLSPAVLHLLEAENLGATGHIPNTFLWEFADDLSPQQVHQRLDDLSGVEFAYPLVEQQHELRMPTLADQWHLEAVTSIWDDFSSEGITGEGVTIGIVDDGLGHTHPNFSNTYRLDLSRDFHEAPNNIYDTDPWPNVEEDNDGNQNWDSHGTAMAGIAAGYMGENGPEIGGVAPGASVVGLRLFESDNNFTEVVTSNDLKEADSLSYLADDIDIYNSSWGPEDKLVALQGPHPQGPSALTAMALHTGVTQGRDGLGSIFVWASGNAGRFRPYYRDRVDYDGYASSRYTIAVAAIDHRDRQASYGEPGASLLISAPSSGSFQRHLPTDRKIVTADLVSPFDDDWTDDYTDNSGGTSAAAAFVSGVVALMLEANPSLTWRDVQHILVDTADQNDFGEIDAQENRRTTTGWWRNGSGRWTNEKYGFGAVDAAEAVEKAKTWQLVGTEVSLASDEMAVDETIPVDAVLERTFEFQEDITVEAVEVMFDATHADRGDLEVVLISPDGTESILTKPHALRDPDPEDGINSKADYNQWLFTSMRHWGESSKGEWKLRVSDRDGNAVDGTWNQWKLNLHGAKPTVTIEATDPDATEGGDPAAFTITRTGSTKYPLDIHYVVASGSIAWRHEAKLGQDYHPPSGVVTIPAGASSAPIFIHSLEDEESELRETVKLQLVETARYETSPISQDIVTIWDNEIPTISLTRGAGYASEAGARERFIMYRRGSLATPITIDYAVAGTAGNGEDYEQLPGSIIFPENRLSFDIPFNILDDNNSEDRETVEIQLIENSDYKIYTDLSGRDFGKTTTTIWDNDGKPTVTVTTIDDRASEDGDPGQIEITRTGDLTQPLRLKYQTGYGDKAFNGQDYEVIVEGVTIPTDQSEIIIPANKSSIFVDIKPLEDNLVELNELAAFWIRSDPAYTVGIHTPTTPSVTIEDNDLPTIAWQRSLGTSGTDLSSTVVVGGDDNVYIAGWTAGSLDSNTSNGNAGIGDAFVAQYSSKGNAQSDFDSEVPPEWLQQLGTAGFDEARGVAMDGSGGIYVTGWTDGDLEYNASSTGRDAWLARYDSNGRQQWKYELGVLPDPENPVSLHAGYDVSNGAMTADEEGNVYIVGHTYGNLGRNAKNQGEADAWVAKYDRSGHRQWIEQLGSENWDEAQGVAVDGAGNIYITGHTQGSLNGLHQGDADAWVAKYDHEGNREWVKQLGTAAWDEAKSIAVDNQGRIYLSGQTKGWLGDTYEGHVNDWKVGDVDAWSVARYGDRSGFGGTYYGNGDAWVAQLVEVDRFDANGTKIGSDGEVVWKRLLGTAAADGSTGVAADDAGNVYLTGFTRGALVKDAHAGGSDVFVAKYNVDGALQWKQQLGSTGDEVANGIALHPEGEKTAIYLTGVTDGDFAGAGQGGEDAWVVKLI